MDSAGVVHNAIVVAVAGELTKAQKAYLTTQAQWKEPLWGAQKRWMTFPPRSTHNVLIRLRLVDGGGQLTPLGLAVRRHMETQDAD